MALRVVGCELKKESGGEENIKDRGKNKQVSPLEVRSANSFGLSGGSVCVLGGFHDRTGWQLMAD